MADVQLSSLGTVIKSAYEGNADTNAFTDAFKATVEGLKITTSGIALLSTSTATLTGSIAIGDNAIATGVADTIATPPVDMIAIGEGAWAYQNGSVAIGGGAKAGATGVANPGNVRRAVALGWGALAENRHSVAIGHLANASGINAISIGDTAGLTLSGSKSISIGNDCGANANGISIGGGAKAHIDCIALGEQAKANNTQARGNAIGYMAVCDHADSVALGPNSETDANFQVRIGSSTVATKLKVAGDVNFEAGITLKYGTWPSTDGSNGQVLTTNGAGVLSWGAGGGAGSDLIVQDEGTQILAAAAALNFVGAGVTVTDGGSSVATITIPSGTAAWGDITGTLSAQTDLQSALNAKQATITDSDDITEGATNLFMTSGERTKLGNIATAATANAKASEAEVFTGTDDVKFVTPLQLKPKESIIVAVSDETTDLTTGTAKLTFRMPYAFELSEVRSSVTTAPTGSKVTVDINETATTILSTKLTIDVSERTSTTASVPVVISDTTLADDAEITIDIDAIGSTIAGTGLKVYLIGNRT